MSLVDEAGKPIVRSTQDLNDLTIAAWLTAWPARTPVTFKSHLRCLSSLCTRAKKKGYLRIDPFDIDSIADLMRQR